MVTVMLFSRCSEFCSPGSSTPLWLSSQKTLPSTKAALEEAEVGVEVVLALRQVLVTARLPSSVTMLRR